MARITLDWIQRRIALVNRNIKSKGKMIILGGAYGRKQLYLATIKDYKRHGGYDKQLMTGPISDVDRFLDGMIAYIDISYRRRKK